MRFFCSSALLLSTLSWSAAPDAFPWSGASTLTDKKGQKLTWAVERVDGEVHIEGSHPKWQVAHRAKPDGTPLSTVKKAGGITTRVTYSSTGALVERTDARGKTSLATIKEKNLWDGDTLDARLAGITWTAGQKLKMRIVAIDEADGSTYPMVAEYAGAETCSGTPCHHVLLALDDFRRLFAPSFDYRFATSAGAKYLQHDGAGMTFVAPGAPR